MASFSSRGPTHDGRMKPDICAPGKDIISTRATGIHPEKAVDNYYLSMSSTSMATPMVSGAIALMVQAQPNLTPAIAKDILERTAKHGKKCPNCNSGFGRINVKAAIDMIKGKLSPAPITKKPKITPTPRPTQPSYPDPSYPDPMYPGYPCPYPGYGQA